MATSRQVYRIAKDIMTTDLITTGPETTLREFARMLDDNEVSGMPIVDSAGRLVGVASKSDLLHRALDPDLGLEPSYVFDMLYSEDDDEEDEEVETIAKPTVVVGDFMTEDAVTASADESVASLARKMIESHIHRIIVVDNDNCPIGIVTSLDLLKTIRE
ncbi:MAG: CBS domain-containing protein [Planctomycetes bacterium]|nr:CBS domain-containing protein [Planctomycetota bacterium]